MIISKTDLIKQLEKKNEKCKRCKEYFTSYDIINQNIEYVENKRHKKNFYHTRCILNGN